jgi:hypothetical protein
MNSCIKIEFKFICIFFLGLNNLKTSVLISKTTNIMYQPNLSKLSEYLFNTEQRHFIDYIKEQVPPPSPNEEEKEKEKEKEKRMTGMVRLVCPGGTGKTFCIRYLKLLYQDELVILCPTHKTVSLYPPYMHCRTIHKFFGASMVYQSDGKKDFSCTVPKKLKETIQCSILVVDEASMINTNMFECFKDVSKYTLVLFTGDDCQLPPIGEELSPIFSNEMKEFKFVQNMRSRDSLIREYNRLFREVVLSNVESPHIRKESTDIVTIDLIEHFKTGEDCVVLAWRNHTVNQWNKLIRKNLFNHTGGNHAILPYYPGENLIFSGYRSIRWESEFNSELMYSNEVLESLELVTDDVSCHEKVYYSNDLVEIVSVEYMSIDVPYFICEHQHASKKPKSKKYLKCEECQLTGRVKLTENLDLIKLTDIDGVYWYKVDPRSWNTYIKYLRDFKKYIINNKSKCTKKERSRLWLQYYKIMETLDAPLKYRYAMTVHLSQGSQFNHVYIDLQDIRACFSKDTHKLAYTAVSRAVQSLRFI